MSVMGSQLILLKKCQLHETFNVIRIIEELGGLVQHVYGTRVIVAHKLDNIIDKITEKLRLLNLFHSFEDITQPENFTETESLGLKAWIIRKSQEFIDEMASLPFHGKPYSEIGMATSDLCKPLQEEINSTPFNDRNSLHRFLIGDVAVAIVFVNGPDHLSFTEKDKEKITARVQEGLDWLGKQDERAKISWRYKIVDASIDLPLDATFTNVGEAEAYWRIPAMASLHEPDVFNFVAKTRHELGAQWGFVIFFSKYHFTNGFPSAYTTRPRVVVNGLMGGNRIKMLPVIIAHETCHIFGCPDEYENCDCTEKYGFLQEVNHNCNTCNTGLAHEDCLMSELHQKMCNSTRVQLGWRDIDNDGMLDPVDPDPNRPNPFIDWRRFARRFSDIATALNVGEFVNGSPDTHESIPLFLLRRVLSDEDMAKVDALLNHEEERHAVSVFRKKFPHLKVNSLAEIKEELKTLTIIPKEPPVFLDTPALDLTNIPLPPISEMAPDILEGAIPPEIPPSSETPNNEVF